MKRGSREFEGDALQRLVELVGRLVRAPIVIVTGGDGVIASRGIDPTRAAALADEVVPARGARRRASGARPSRPARASLLEPLGRARTDGALVVVDKKSRRWTPAERASVREIARAVRAELRVGRSRAPIARRSTNALAQQPAFLRDLLEHAPMSVFVLDVHGRILLANAAAARGFDRTVPDLEGQPFASFVRPEVGATILARDAEVRRTRVEQTAHETLVGRGRIWHYQVTKFPVAERHGFEDAIASFVVDITSVWVEQRRARALAELAHAVAADVDAADALEALAELALPEFADWCSLMVGEPSSPLRSIGARHVDPSKEDSIVRLFHDAPLPEANAHGYGYVYRTGEPLLVEDATELWSKAARLDPRRAPYADDIAPRSYVVVPVRVRDKVIGAIAMALGAASPRRYFEDDVAFFVDVATRVGVSLENHELRCERERVLAKLADANAELERRVAERTAELETQNELLREARAAADRANETKSRFLAQMSHEIRTPMNAVLGMATLLLETPLTEAQRDSVRTLQSSADALLGILNELLDVAKIEAGRVELEARPVALHDVLRDAVDLFASTAVRKGIDLQLEVAPDVPRGVVGDPTRLRQIVVNLVGNAIKFTERGRITVDVSAPVTPDPAGRRRRASDVPGEALPPRTIRIAVRDTGIGISKSHLASLFEPFVQVYDASKKTYGGAGLGLSLVRNFVEKMGGRVEVSSEMGEGSELVVWLTLAPAALPSDKPHVSPFDAALATNHPLRLLIAEDNPVNQLVARGMLGRFGYEADIVENGDEAVRAVESKPYDVVLMDVQMPVVDGIEATRLIRAHPALPQRPRIIAMTASSYPEDRAKCAAAGMDDFLAKPVRATELGAALRRAYEARDAERSGLRGPEPATER